MANDYDDDRRFCPRCGEYVRYLRSPRSSWCVECAGRTKLFSETDRLAFNRSLQARSSTLKTLRSAGFMDDSRAG